MSSPQPPRKVIEIKAAGDPEAKVYPRSVDGPFTRWRWFFVWLTQLVFYGVCWIPWDGRQAVLFDLDARKFYLFDLVLWPQDTIYLVMLMIIGAFALFLFTPSPGEYGVVTVVRRRSIPRSSCGWKRRSRASVRSA
nr:hypothetical protein [Dechloromonas sp.]